MARKGDGTPLRAQRAEGKHYIGTLGEWDLKMGMGLAMTRLKLEAHAKILGQRGREN
jgi:hypothetical protein